MNDQPARGGAALSGRSHGAKQNSSQRHVKISILGDNDGVVATKLKQASPQPLTHNSSDTFSNTRGTGGRNQRHAMIGKKIITYIFRSAGDEVYNTFRNIIFFQYRSNDVPEGVVNLVAGGS